MSAQSARRVTSRANFAPYQPAWQAQKEEVGGRRKCKKGKGKGAPAIRAGVFVFRSPISQRNPITSTVST